MSADASPHDGSLGRRALITGAAVLGAAGVAAVAQAPDARAANGDALRVGRDDNSATAPTLLTVSRPRGFTPSIDPALKVLDNRSNRDAIAGTAANGGRGVVGVGGTGVQGTGNGYGGIFTGNVGVDGTSVTAAGVGVRGQAGGTGGTGVKGTGEGVGVDGRGGNGVYGESGKVGGKGVFGVATQAEGAASHGVYGQTASAAGAGVYGKGPSYDPDLEWNVTSYGVFAEGAIASTGPAFLGVPEYGTTARGDSRLQEGSMTFSADFSTPTPRLYVLVKSSDGRLFKAELPLTAL
jgi:hypothetical protein